MANRELSEDEIADLKEAFDMFDINGDGESR
jgi:Ca2+-binding EF-hand superfamily protein